VELSPCAERQDCSPSPSAHPPAANLLRGTDLPAPSLRGEVKDLQPCRAHQHGLCFWYALSKCNPACVVRGACWQQPQARLGRAGGQQCLLGSREVGKQAYSLLDSTSGASRQTQMLEPTWEEKAKKTNNVIQCPWKGMIISQRGLKAPAGPCVRLAAS